MNERRACDNCGALTLPDARFCVRCGDPVASAAEPPTAKPSAAAEPAGREPAGREPVAAGEPAPDRTQVLPERRTTPHEGPGARADRTALRACVVCDAPNSARRAVCGRCGAPLRPARDLAADRIADAASGSLTDPGADGTRERRVEGTRGDLHRGAAPEADGASIPSPGVSARRPRRWVTVVLVVVAGVAVGTALGLLMALELGPFAAEPVVPPPPAFDQQIYEQDPGEVRPATLSASSVLPPAGDRSFGPAQMMDGDLATAWNSDAAADHAVIDVAFDEPVWLEHVVLANGDQSDDGAFLGNARLRRATLLLDAGQRLELRFLDDRGRQVIQFDRPRLTTTARLDAEAVYAGDIHEDLAIAELGFQGWVAQGRDVVAAQQRAAS